jgi:isocitrate/isopropylmalate dehydrogenase
MILKYLGESKVADRVEKTVVKVLGEGKSMTRDLGGNTGTVEYAKAVMDAIKKEIK